MVEQTGGSSRKAMLLAALKRLAVLVVAATALTMVGATLLGLLVGASIERSLTLGFYGVGCFFLVAGFFVGNRGPARVRSEGAGGNWVPFPLFGNRRLRWATSEEREEAINLSAVFVTLGLILVFIGILFDSRHGLT